MNELNGLRALVGSTGMLHGIQEPPDREAFQFEEEYLEAVDAWWLTTHTWRTSIAYRDWKLRPSSP